MRAFLARPGAGMFPHDAPLPAMRGGEPPPRRRAIAFALALLLIAFAARAEHHILRAHVIGVHDGDVPSAVEGFMSRTRAAGCIGFACRGSTRRRWISRWEWMRSATCAGAS